MWMLEAILKEGFSPQVESAWEEFSLWLQNLSDED